MTPRDTPKHRRARRHNMIAASLLLGVIVAVAGLGIVYQQARRANPSLNEDLCLPGQAPPEAWAVLIDVTDGYNPVQVHGIANTLREVQSSMPRYALLRVYSITSESTAGLTPLVSLCNPGDGTDLSMVTSNPARAREMWQTAFREPVEDLTDSLLGVPMEPLSPIMETIQAVVVSMPRPAAPVNRMIIVSDMLQHSDNLSHYSQRPTYEAFRSTVEFGKVRTDLQGWQAEILYIRRDGASQDASHRKFWSDYLVGLGATRTSIERIDG